MAELDWSETAGSNTTINGVNIAEGCPPSGINNAIREIMSARATALTRRVVKSTGYTALKADHGQLIEFDSALTLSLTAAATLTDGWMCIVRANGGDVTIDPNSSETVNGATTYIVKDGSSVFLFCNASAFFAINGHSFDSLLDAGADVATASTIDLDAATGPFVNLTGTTTVTAVTLAEGRMRIARAADVFTLTASSPLRVHESTSIDYTTVAGDLLLFEGYASSIVRVWLISPRNTVLGTEQATTSGTAINFTGIPLWARTIRIMFAGVSTSGTSPWRVRIGDSGGIETTNYFGTAGFIDGATTNTAVVTDGFGLFTTSASAVVQGILTLSLEDSANNGWVIGGTLSRSDSAVLLPTSGFKALSGGLDRLQITTAGGSDTFDTGDINISYTA